MLRYLKNLFFTFKEKHIGTKNRKKNPNSGFDFNKKLVYSLSKSKIPTLRQFKYLPRYLSKKESLVIKLSIFLIFSSLLFIGISFYRTHLEIRPINGGEYIEGLIGAPKHINPLYASINDVDSDLASLIFSSLYKRNGQGSLDEDLVESLSISEDGKKYTIKIKDNVFWHDGEKLTSDDVVFTLNAITNQEYQSPLRAGLLGVSIEKIDDLTFNIFLTRPYGAFKDLLTFGIMPAHLWEQLKPESSLLHKLNINAIGSGPYKFKRLLKDDTTGRILYIELESNKQYFGKIPYIDNLTFRFYPNFEELIVALNEDVIDGLAYLPTGLKEQVASQNSLNFYKLDLTQVLSLNFNSKNNIFLEKKNTRKALANALDKEQIIQDVFSGDARVIDSPILPESFAYKSDLKKYEYNKGLAIDLLSEEGWSLATITPEDLIDEENNIEKDLGEGHWLMRTNEDDEVEYLVIEISIINSDENRQIAGEIKKYWEDIGVKTNIKEYDSKELRENIIANREYQALLYTQSLSYDPDVYSFWHSSQAVTGGNNISNYFNGEVDRLLSEARVLSDADARKKMYFAFQDILVDEVPAIFISSPKYTYVQKKDIKNFDVTSVSTPSDRFSNISYWYINTGKKIIW